VEVPLAAGLLEETWPIKTHSLWSMASCVPWWLGIIKTVIIAGQGGL